MYSLKGKIMTPSEARKLLQQKKENEVKDLIKVANNLVEGFVSRSNAVALKMLFYIAKQQYKESGEITKFKLSANEFADYCKLDHRTIKDNIKAMQNTSVSFIKYDEKGKPLSETWIVLIPRVLFDYEKKEKTIEIDIFKEILDLIVEVENHFTTIDVKNVMELESKYSIRMVMILEQIFGFKGTPENWDVKQQKTYSLDDLNGMFDTKYKKITDFERYVLKSTKVELDDKSEISFEYEIKYGYNSPLDRGRPKALGVTIKLKQNKIRQRRLF